MTRKIFAMFFALGATLSHPALAADPTSFTLEPKLVVAHQCPSLEQLDACALEFDFPGPVQIALINGNGTWMRQMMVGSIRYQVQIDVTWNGHEFELLADLQVDENGTLYESAGVFLRTPNEKSLNTVATSTNPYVNGTTIAYGFLELDAAPSPSVEASL